MDTRSRATFYDVLSAAISDITEHGFDQSGRLEYWIQQLREAAERHMQPLHYMEQMLRSGLWTIYKRLVEKGGIAKYHERIAKFTVQQLTTQMRSELDKRILASANLIKLNRQQAIEKTLQRFTGWSTSIPAGGSETTAKRETATEIKKALSQLPFQERRVLIDQGHKLTASINEVVATHGGAIALIWRSHWRQAGYNYREDHKERDGQVYAIRGSWALENGLMKPGEAGYYDKITAVAEEPFCRCYAQYIYNLSSLPKDMLTKKGEEELARVRGK